MTSDYRRTGLLTRLARHASRNVEVDRRNLSETVRRPVLRDTAALDTTNRMKPYNVALVGCGTVGGGVAELLLQHADRIAARAGRPIVLKRVVVRDPAKVRDFTIPKNLVATDLRTVLDDPTIDCAIEVVGGVDWARKAVLDLLAAGKEIVTANKALLALHGAEVFDAGRRHEKAI